MQFLVSLVYFKSILFVRIIAKGAGGGQGSGRVGQSRGAEARLLTGLSKGQQLYILVGQAGANAPRKTMVCTSIFIWLYF